MTLTIPFCGAAQTLSVVLGVQAARLFGRPLFREVSALKAVVTLLSFLRKLGPVFERTEENRLHMQMTERIIPGPAAGVLSAVSRAQILVVEDDVRMQKILYRLFTEQNYAVTVCGDGQSGLDAFRSSRPAAVVLDLMLPNIFGRDLCRTIKAERPGTPVIIVSAISEVADKVLLLEIGADDYVTKPFSPRELMARVQAAIRRTQKTPAAATTYSFGDCRLDFAKMSAERSGSPVALTAHEFKLLRYFVENPERVLSREELLNEVWGYNSYPTTRTVDNQILKLRQKLEPDAAEPRHLRTVHGAGYKFIP